MISNEKLRESSNNVKWILLWKNEQDRYSQRNIFFIWQLYLHGYPVTVLVIALTTPDNFTIDPFMSPVSPVFHNVVTVSIGLKNVSRVRAHPFYNIKGNGVVNNCVTRLIRGRKSIRVKQRKYLRCFQCQRFLQRKSRTLSPKTHKSQKHTKNPIPSP